MKVTFDFSAEQIVVEGDGAELFTVLQLAKEIAPSLPQMQIITTKSAAAQRAATGLQPQSVVVAQLPHHSGQTVRQFVRALDLGNTSEKIAAIAYYLKNFEAKDSFAPKDMSDLFGVCGFQKPSQMGVALFDGKKRYGYVDSAGHGKWRVTTNGENLIIGKLNDSEDSKAE